MKYIFYLVGALTPLGGWFKQIFGGLSPAAFVFIFLFLFQILKKNIRIPRLSEFRWFLIFIFCTVFSRIVNWGVDATSHFFNFFLYLIIIITTFNILDFTECSISYFKSYVIGSFFVCVITLFSAAGFYDLTFLFGFRAFGVENGLLVLNGSEENPGGLAYHLISSLPFAYHFSKTSSGSARYFYRFVFLTLSFCLVLTFSRGAIFGLILSTGFVLIKSTSQFSKRNVKKLMVFLLCLIFTLSGYIQLNSGEVSNLVVNKKISEDIRYYVLASSVDLIVSNPFFGIGSGRFLVKFPGNEQIEAHEISTAHNSFINIAVENGILASLSMIMMFISLLSRLNKNVSGEKQRPAWYSSLWITVASLMIDGLFHDNYINSGYWTFIAILIACNYPHSFKKCISFANKQRPVVSYSRGTI